MSGLNITHAHRNLHTRVTFLYLEFEDAFVILGIAASPTSSDGSCTGRLRVSPERVPAIHRPDLDDPAANRIQVREAPALPLRFPGVAHEAAGLLRHRAGFSAEGVVPEGGPTRMPLTMRQHEVKPAPTGIL